MTINQARRVQLMARWHRRLALFVMVWLVLLAASGLVINHANDWGLDQAPLAKPIQSWFYGIEQEGVDHCMGVTAPSVACHRVFARLTLPSGQLLLSQHSLWILDAEGELLEQLPVAQTGLESLDAGLLRDGQIYLGSQGKIVRAGPELLEFHLLTLAEAAVLDEADWSLRDNAASAITWERFVLDLHAARFLGPLAKVFNDIMAVLILLIALSGASLHRLRRKANALRDY